MSLDNNTEAWLIGIPRYELLQAEDVMKLTPVLVAPAELESVLIQHPDIVDAGVIGVYSEEEVTELPR